MNVCMGHALFPVKCHYYILIPCWLLALHTWYLLSITTGHCLLDNAPSLNTFYVEHISMASTSQDMHSYHMIIFPETDHFICLSPIKKSTHGGFTVLASSTVIK